MRTTVAAIAFLASLLLAASVEALADYPLTLDVIAKLRQVMLAMDAWKPTSPESMRPDIATIMVLMMAMPDRNATAAPGPVAGTGPPHDELSIAIHNAGLSVREYALAWAALLPAHLTAAARRGGRDVDIGATPANVAFVDRYWTDVDGFMTEVGQRLGPPPRRP